MGFVHTDVSRLWLPNDFLHPSLFMEQPNVTLFPVSTSEIQIRIVQPAIYVRFIDWITKIS